jgi:two-component system, NtrC family, C4-dicarboxylate transport sensor histidine kinase DctB
MHNESARQGYCGGNIPVMPPDWAGSASSGNDADGNQADRMKSARQYGLIAIVFACAAALVFAVYRIAAGEASDNIHAAVERQLKIVALDLGSALEKFETLPFTLSFHPDVVAAVTRSDRTVGDRLNPTLKAIQRQAKVAAIYLMDREGNTLASSNADEPVSFVGRNFRFRPYFQQAIEGNAGSFYGIGTTSGEAGYFIAQPVYPLGAARNKTAPPAVPIGVIAVKISLAEFERAWRSSEEPIALADRNGVVFLSNREEWKFHSLRLLDARSQRELAQTQQYLGRAISPIMDLPAKDRAGFGEFVAKPVGRLGWQLMLFPAPSRVTRVAATSAAATALLLAIAIISYWAVHQRRRRLEERVESRKALQKAAEELDRRIALRTEELVQANLHLETRYVKLKETEQLLRTTQNELVQAGKLAMLGQMAAGVTHELNQPLAAIRAFADNAVIFLTRGQGDQAGENLSHISAAAARMGAIIAQLKGFARKTGDALSNVDLAQSIQASAMLLEGEARRLDALIDIDIREAVHVIGDPVRTEQVLINLLRNALDAVETASERRVTIVLQREQDEAVIRIRDSGPGIPEDVAPHLFVPFYTTKAAGKGLGLGLAISSSIIQAMDGQLTAYNHTGGGAEFMVRLPVARNETVNDDGGKLVNA